MTRLPLSRFGSVFALLLGLASFLPSAARAQLQWSAYNSSGALIGTQNQAATFDPVTATYTFSVPAAGQYTFVTTNFVPITMTAPASGTTIQTISYKMKSSAGWTGANTSNRINQLGLFNYGATAPAATGNFLDDNGLFGNLKGGAWGDEVFGGTSGAAGLLGGYQSTLKLGSGKANGTTTAWTLVDDNFVNITMRIALTSAGAFSLGTSGVYANAGILVEDSTAVGAGTSYQTIYSAAAATVTAPKTFNEYAFYFRNDAATAATITISNVAGLTPPPYFTAVTGQPPATLTGSVGDNLSIAVSAVGTSIAYQWQKSTDNGATFTTIDSVANPSAAMATLLLNSVQSADAAQYQVIISNAAGSTTSTVCAVTVTSGAVAPSVQTDPQVATILVGGANTFTVTASGTAPLGYQWQKSTDNGANYADIPGATNATYAVSSAQFSDAGLYRVTVTNTAGSASSGAAALAVNQVPAFTTQPTGATLNAGDSLTLTAAASIGTPAPTYQWKLNNVAIAGATSPSYAISTAAGANAGNYTVVATNTAGSATSATATVNVLSSSLTLASVSPARNATGAFPDQSFTVGFSAPIFAGLSGAIKIYDASSPATPVDTINFASATVRVASASQAALPVQSQSIGGQAGLNYYPVAISGSTLTIYPRNGTLTYGKTYYVTIDAGAILDGTGATYGGFSDNSSWSFTTKAAGPDAGATMLTVANDGSGDFYTVQGALDFIPAANTVPTTIYIKNGTYTEIVSWTAKSNLTFLGQSRAGVVVGYANNNNFNPTGTAWRAAFTCRGGGTVGTVITNLTLKNFTAKTGSQAETLYLSGTATGMQAVITGVNLISFQDTLLINGQAYVSDTYIEGDTDFMWGTGPVYFTNCELKAMSIQSYYTQVRNAATNHGFVYVNCKFSAAADSQNSANPVSGCYLGRLDQNAGPHTEMVLLNCTMGDHILAVGWNPNGQAVPAGTATTNCVEFNSRKISDASLVNVSQRVSWSFQWTSPTNDVQIANFTDPVWVLNTAMDGTSTTAWSPALKPLIVSQPVGATLTEGNQVTFTVGVSAVPAGTYQWRKNGTDIAAAISATYAISSVALADAADYSVAVTNASGTTVSAVATLAVNAAPATPVITTQPVGQTVLVGTDVSFTVAATGTPAPTYQWKFNGTDISGATNPTLNLSAVQSAAAGDYTVVVTNSVSSLLSSVATLVVQSPPSAPASSAATGVTSSGFTANWATVSGATGYRLDVSTSSTFATFVTGYQDLDVGANLTKAVTGLSASTTYYYRVRAVSAGGASGSSDPVTVATSAAAIANLSIVSTGTTSGRTYSLNGSAYTQNFDTLPSTGTTFTWANDTNLPGWYAVSTAGTFDASGVVIDGTANMVDLKIGSLGTSASTDRALAYHTRLNTAPTYLGVSLTNNSGRDLTAFTLSYTAEQWRESGSARNLTFTVQYRVGAIATDLNATTGWTTISGLGFSSLNGSATTTATLTATAVPAAVPAGSTIWFRWITANDATSSTSSNDIIAVDNVSASFAAVADGSPLITTQPATQTVAQGANVTFTVVASGDPTLAYQWVKDGNNVASATNPSLVISSAQAADAGSYTVVVTNGKGSATSNPAVLTVNVPMAPSITTQPQSQTVTAGANVTFTVVASGTAPLSYVWKHDGNVVVNATSPSLALTSVQTADGGNYTVDVTNSVSTLTSAIATLTVQAVVPQAPAITTQPVAQTVSAGGTATFTVVATGTAPLSYQWFKGNTAITTATGPTLTLSNVQSSDTANYSVTVTNAISSVTSNSVGLIVSAAIPTSNYNLAGFATVGSGTTGGGVIADTDAAYRKVTTPQEFVQAIIDSNKTAGKVKVIEIMNDLNLGWIEVGATVQGLASNPLRSHATPRLHPTLISTGVSVLDIKAKSPLTIFSASGVTIKHVNFNIKGTTNIVIRNLKFDEMWEWDEASKGNYDDNDWDFITISNGGDAGNIWIDHCTFTKAYDGIVDLKAGTTNVTISWCRYIGDDGATNPNSPVRIQLAALEANKASYPFYNFLRTNGFSVDDIAQIIQGHDKGHLMGSNDMDPQNDTLTGTFHHNWMKNVWDRAVPRLRGGNVHDYNIFVDDTDALVARRLRDAKANLLSTALKNTLNNTYSFAPPLNGAISTEGGSLLVEKSIYKDCLWPLRNNQTDVTNPAYTGKIKSLDSIYSFLNTDSSRTIVRGDSTDAGNPMGPFQAAIIPFAWDLAGGVLPYTYTMDDPAQLESILATGAGAGALTWSKDNWLKTTYVVDPNAPPVITAQPESLSVATGADATLTVQATAGGTLTYQWQKGGTNLTDGGRISGSTSAVLTIATTVAGDADTYTVVVTSGANSVPSSPATLTITAATIPVIATQPASQTAVAGTDVTLSVVATGSAPFTYQWQLNNADVVGETGSSITITAAQPSNSGSYTVIVTNTAGSVTSTAATLVVGTAPDAPNATAATNYIPGGFTANWSAVSGATGYQLDVSTDSAFGSFVSGYSSLVVGNNLSAAVTGLNASTAYYYQVRAVNAYGTGVSSSVITATTTSDQPPALTTLDVSQLSWYQTRSADSVAANTTTKTVTFTEGQASASAFITHLPSAVNLTVGQTLTLTLTFQTGSNLPSTTNALRIGLFNANGTRATGTSQNSETLPANTFNDDVGYMASYTFNSGAGSLQSRIPGSGNPGLMNSTSAGLYLSQGATNPSGTTAAFAAAKTYTLTFTISRLATSTLFWARLNGDAVSNYLLTGADATTASATNGTYDEFALRVAAGNTSVNTITVTGLTVAVGATVPYTDKPVIVTPPVNQFATVNGTATFTAVANGIAPLTYQWQKDGTAISGATSATLSLTQLQLTDAGGYSLVVSNLAGSTVSSAATLAFAVPVPVISVQPLANQAVVSGNAVSFSVTASGPSLSYQWKKDGNDIAGATSSTLTLATPSAADSGLYTVAITGPGGTIVSSGSRLTVASLGGLTWQSYDQTGARLSADAASFNPETNTYTFTIPANLTVTLVTSSFQPLILTKPATGASNLPVTFTMQASGGYGLNGSVSTKYTGFGLFNDGGTPAGATGNFTDDKGMWIEFYQTSGNVSMKPESVTSATPFCPVSLFQSDINTPYGLGTGTGGALGTVNDNLLVDMTVRPSASTAGAVSLGTSSSTAAVSGGVLVDHATNGLVLSRRVYSSATNGLSVASASITFNEFGYHFQNSTANPVTLQLSNFVGLVAAPYFIIEPPATSTVTVGDSLTLTTSAAGSPTSYRWQYSADGSTYTDIDSVANVSAATAALTIPSAQTANAGSYHVIITNAGGSATSLPTAVTVSAAPFAPIIEVQPLGRTVSTGVAVSLRVVASGTAPVTYQWQKNSTDVAGATSATLTIASTAVTDGGSYTVIVTNGQGSVTSSAAVLTVNYAPIITTQPASATVSAGAAVNLSVVVDAVPTASYQWKKNGVAITNATSSTYSLPSVAAADAANYTVVISNSAGATTSNIAAVNVLSTALSVSSRLPSANATGVFPDAPLTLTFNQAITAGLSGTIKIYDTAAPGTPVDTIDFTSAAPRTASAAVLALPVQTKTVGTLAGFSYYPVLISGNTATIYPRNLTLTYGKTYYVTVDSGVFLDSTGAAFAGFSDSSTWSFTTRSSPATGAATYTVATDGSGDFASVQGALDFIPANNTAATTILIQPGTYTEIVYWTAKNNLTIRGASRTGTIVGYRNNNTLNPQGTNGRAAFEGRNSTGTFLTNLSIQNFTPSGGTQAEALYLNNLDNSQTTILGVNLSSYQDTLNVNGPTYIGNSYIEGDTDFMWGNGPVFFENCELRMRTSSNYFTQVRNPVTNHGFVYLNCLFSAVDGVTGSYLGRLNQNAPATTEVVLINSREDDDMLNPLGWDLNTNTALQAAANTLVVEYNCTAQTAGTPVSLAGRVTWAKTWDATVNATDIANYSNATWVLNTQKDGTAKTTPTTWTPALTPQIITAPVAVSTSAGSAVSFSVEATGIPVALSYQWQKNGTAISGATSATYSIATSALSDAGDYTVVVTNTAGSVTSAAAALALTAAPVITTAPVSQTVNVGASVTFTAAASGSPTPTFQWKKDGTAISGATNATLTLSNVQSSAAGSYTVVATNSISSTESSAAVLTVNIPVPVPVVTSGATALGKVGEQFGYAIIATNSPLSYAASDVPGLTVDAKSGIVSGLPTTAATFTMNVTATNVTGTSLALAVQVTISPAAAAPVISSSTSATATVGTAFTYQITASNTPTTFTATGLPDGLRINAAGLISGTPTTAGNSSIQLSAANVAGSGTAVLQLKVVSALAAPAITSSGSATGKVGVLFSYATKASNTPTSFSAAGLPAGLTFSTASGVISGTPTVAGTFAVTLTGSNAAGTGAAFTLTLTITSAAQAPVVTSDATAIGTQGQAFTYQITATNGPLTAYAATGLPAGLSVDVASGIISGQPTAVGSATVLITATNAAGTSAPLSLLITIQAAADTPVVTSSLTASATQGQAFTYTIMASAGPTSFAATGLPTGLALNPANGVISGTPTVLGSFSVALTATNDAGTSAAKTLTLNVNPAPNAPVISSGDTAAATAGTAFTYQITASGSPSSFDAADRPAWLTVDTATGLLSGTPTAPGVYTTKLTATNATGTSGSVTLSITVAAAAGSPVITSTLGAAGTANAAFSYQIGASPGPITAYAVGVVLPSGLSLDPVTGIISGTPDTPGSYSIPISATNAVGIGAAKTLVVTLDPAAGSPVIGAGSGPTSDSRRAATTSAPLGTSGTVGIAFAYQIVASNNPLSYTATGLPGGLALNPATGVISGVPVLAGTYTAQIGAINSIGIGGSVPLVITIAPSALAPVITGSLVASGTAGQVVTYQAAASNTPTSFNATGLPAGLTFDSTTGAISGTTNAPGVYSVAISANNAAGTGAQATLVLTIAPAASAPVVSSSATAAGTVGALFTYQVTASNTPTSYAATGLAAGLTLDATSGAISGTPVVDGQFSATLTASNASGASTPFALTITIAPSAATSVITSTASVNVVAGSNLTYVISATNAPLSYNISTLPAGLTADTTAGTISGIPTVPGTYTMTVTANNLAGTGPVTVITLTVAPNNGTSNPQPTGSRIVNLSSRAAVGTGDDVLIVGFVITGTDPKPVMIRGVGGPTLTAQNVSGVLADPVLDLYQSGTVIGNNDNWGTAGVSTTIASEAVRLGAFALPIGSVDSVIYTTLQPGVYSAIVSGAGVAKTGVALVEIYDATTTYTDTSPRLVNVSSRGHVGTGDNLLIGGFVITGDQPKQVLIRGVGPALIPMNVPTALVDPVLTVYQNGVVVAQNDNWGSAGDSAALATAAASVGAGALPVGSKDAAILLTLQPGVYSAIISGANGTTGIALVEVYEIVP